MSGFFQFFEHTSSKIDKLLEVENPNLEQVLTNPLCFQECMTGNTKLLGFLSLESNVSIMLDLMLLPLDEEVPYLAENEEPEPDADDEVPHGVDRRARLAYAASEVFVSDAVTVLETASRVPELLLKIFKFLDQKNALDENRTYFAKVLTALLRTNVFAARVTGWLYIAKETGEFDIIASITRHISVVGVQQCLLTLLTPIDIMDVPPSRAFVNWSMANGLLESIMAILENKTESEEADQDKAGILWVAVGILSLDTYGHHPEMQAALVPFITWLSSHSHEDSSPFVPAVVDLLTERCRSNPDSSIIPLASDILHRVARAYTFQTIYASGQCTDSRVMTYGLEKLLERASDFKSLLEKPPAGVQPIQLQTISIKLPFGLMRLKILELVRAIGLVELPEVYMWFLDEGILPLLLEIFDQHPHNNLVHSLVTGTIRSLVSSSNPEVIKRLKETVDPAMWVAKMYEAGKDPGRGSFSGFIFELAKVILERGDPILKEGVECWEDLKVEIGEESDRRIASSIDIDFNAARWSEAGMGRPPGGDDQDDSEEVVCLKLPGMPPPPALGQAWEANPVTEPREQGMDWGFTPQVPSPSQGVAEATNGVGQGTEQDCPEEVIMFPPPTDFAASSLPDPPAPTVSSSPPCVPATSEPPLRNFETMMATILADNVDLFGGAGPNSGNQQRPGSANSEENMTLAQLKNQTWVIGQQQQQQQQQQPVVVVPVASPSPSSSSTGPQPAPVASTTPTAPVANAGWQQF
eukprot:TRINITY_DN3397_c0_g4_i1.p1 TRINITY_DN3397_c0_g4~~TRINITY_DN3397_c0_g4_i1.p1  ORF type:complete len:760 (+),score=142.95 TRINITY_DN3397_c0_g4_i1:24-2282(+)